MAEGLLQQQINLFVLANRIVTSAPEVRGIRDEIRERVKALVAAEGWKGAVA